MRNTQRGFTLLELIITMMIFGLLFGMGLPAMTKMIQSSSVRQLTNEMVRDMNLARSMAVDLNQVVTICRRHPTSANTCHAGGSGNNWQNLGWYVFIDEDKNRKPKSADTIRRTAAPNDKALIHHQGTSGAHFSSAFSFFPDGTIKDRTMTRNNGVEVTFKVCPNEKIVQGRTIKVSSRGDIRTDILDVSSC